MTCSISAQNIKRPDSYNYNRGVEAIQNNNAEEALEYLNKELEDNPNNGYALAWIATVRNYQVIPQEVCLRPTCDIELHLCSVKVGIHSLYIPL